MSGTGTVTQSIDGGAAATVRVGGIPTLYTSVTGKKLRSGTLHLRFSPGVSAYAFTFG